MMRVIARHVAVDTVADPARFCAWAREVAVAEAAEGWVAPSGDGIEAWFEGSVPAVEAMLDWCVSTLEIARNDLESTTQRPVLGGGFDLLEAPPDS